MLGLNRRPPSPWTPLWNLRDATYAGLYLRHSPEEAARLFREAGREGVSALIVGPDWSPPIAVLADGRRPE